MSQREPHHGTTVSSAQADTAAQVAQWLAQARHVCVVTGAGMSAESGIPTFRGTDDSLWSRFDPQQLATAEAWRADSELVWGWYRWRMAGVQRAQPNAGHCALAALAARHGSVALVTQNVDDLHERAGSTVAAHVHGNLFALRCFDCGHPHDAPLAPCAPDSTPLRPRATGVRPLRWPGAAGRGLVWRGAARGCVACGGAGSQRLRADAGGRHFRPGASRRRPASAGTAPWCTRGRDQSCPDRAGSFGGPGVAGHRGNRLAGAARLPGRIRTGSLTWGGAPGCCCRRLLRAHPPHHRH